MHMLQFPWHANIKTNILDEYCGGSLISQNHVLTSGFCVYNKTLLTVTLGSVIQDNPGEMIYTSNYTVHPDYSPVFRLNDIAIVVLPRNLVFRHNVRSISLPTTNRRFDSFESEECFLSGFGGTVGNQYISYSRQLEYANQRIISNEVCREEHAIFGANPPPQVSNTIICASSAAPPSRLPQGMCRFDEGGPLVSWLNGTWIQIGVASIRNNRFGDPCNANFPQVYTRITPYLDWISETTGIQLVP